MITARVSNVAAYARWKGMEDLDVDWLVNDLTRDEPTEAMLKGTAFHKFLEHAQAGEYETAEVDGYTFAFAGEFNLYRPPTREWRKGKDYGGIIVSGQVDAIEGKTIWDDKSTECFHAEKYLDSWQHPFYLDIFDADHFIWNIWEMNELKEPKSYGVHHLHKLEQFRYPGLHDDCVAMAQEYREFALKYLPQQIAA